MGKTSIAKLKSVKRWRENNKEKVAKLKKKYADKNKEKIAEYQRKYREKNKEKMKAYNIEYRKTNPPKKRTPEQYQKSKPYRREVHLNKKYGLTVDEYKSMLASQGGRCAICLTDDPRGKKHNWFHVDHCHKTGKVRGLLCSRCNMGLGSFQDNADLLEEAINYIRKSKT